MQNSENNTPLISVIVPVYNAENTLRKCVESLLAQTFTRFEVLLINDGSIDNSAELCNTLSKEDSRVRVFHQSNAGVSSARQLGVNYARGIYSIHTDPDDWVEPQMLSHLYQKAVEEQADMVIANFYINTYKGQEHIIQRPTALNHKTILKELFSHLHGSTCNKLVKHSLYTRYNISFPKEISFCEDLFVISSMLLQPIKVAYLPQAYYHYVRDEQHNSLSLRYHEKMFQQDLHLIHTFDNLLKGTAAQPLAHKQNCINATYRAFLGGEKLFSSSQYKKHFYKNTFYILCSNLPILHKILVIFACMGFYQPIIKIVNRYLRKKK